MVSGNRSDLLGRVIGMLVFLVGVALLMVVFYIAYHLFNASPAQALGITITGDPKRDPAAAAIGTQFGWLLLRIAYLLIMGFAGSLVATKGINLYFSALQGSPINAVSSPVSTPAPPSA